MNIKSRTVVDNKMEKVYDLIIVGAGPAGITAAIYAARKKMDCLVLTVDVGGQTAWSGDIENYTGYQFVSGRELTAKFEEHIKKYNVKVKENEAVKELRKEGGKIFVKTEKNTYLSRSLIIASGKKSKELSVPGEKEYKNKGLTYCATCDGPLFEGKEVVVVGGGNSALDAALQLIRIAKKVYVMNISDKLAGDAVMRDKLESADNVTVINNAEVIKILGRKMVEGLRYRIGDEEKELSAGGVFVEIGLIPNSEFTRGIDKNKQGEILVNSITETNVPGIFAAGDVTDVIEKQIIIAAGEGAKAALKAFRYLLETEEDI